MGVLHRLVHSDRGVAKSITLMVLRCDPSGAQVRGRQDGNSGITPTSPGRLAGQASDILGYQGARSSDGQYDDFSANGHLQSVR